MAFGSHPSFDITGTYDSSLEGKKIVLCITGSVAAVRSPDIARVLMRKGASVYTVMSESACRIIGPDLMEWACGTEPVTMLTGAVEHVALAGNVKGKADLVVVAPCTANTIGKIACGIDDTPVTTVVTTALGEGIPTLIVPAMHEPMYRHPFVAENIAKLEKAGIAVLKPRIAEGKAKIPGDMEIADKISSLLNKDKILSGKKVLVTAGRTVEYIDPVRVITNNSSGKMGFAIACAARDMGADVTVIYGRGSVVPPSDLRVMIGETAEKMKDAVEKELSSGEDTLFFAAAAVGDWQPLKVSEEKISTRENKNLVIELRPTPKIIDGIKEKFPKVFLAAFRALHHLSPEELISDGKKRMAIAGADMIAVNDVSGSGRGFESDTNEMYVVCKDGSINKFELASKYEIARKLVKLAAEKMEEKHER